MERSLARVTLPPRHATVVGLGVCALGLAGVGLFAGADGVAWSSMMLVGSSLLAAAAAGFATHPSRDSAAQGRDVLDPQQVAGLLGASGDGTWDYDLRTGRIVYNPACATMLGYAADEVTSTLSQWGTLVHEDDLPRARRALDDYLEGRTDRYRVHVRMRRKGGGWTRVLDCGRVVARDKRGRPQRALGIHREVPAEADCCDVAAAVSSDLDQALAGLLGQATLASSPGEGAELERAAWRCVGLANRLRFATVDESEAPTETDVGVVARRILEDAEQWTANRVLLRVRNAPEVGTVLLSQSVFQSLVQLGIDDAIERIDLDGGLVEVRLGTEPNLVLRITATPARPARGSENKRMDALRGLAARHGIAVSSPGGSLQLAWPARGK